MVLDNKAIETLSVNAVKNSIVTSEFLDQFITDNDKEPSWDGDVYIYSDKSKKKNAIIGRMPVQIKGMVCNDFSKDEILFQISKDDLRNYLNDGCCIFFVVYLRDTDAQSKIYYAELTPNKLCRLIEGENKSKSVRLKTFPFDGNEKFKIFSNCFQDYKKQKVFIERIRLSGGILVPTLEWIGKDKVINHHQDVPFRVLERKYSFDENGQHDEDNGSENMIIRGDNLEALKALLPRYEGRAKCIYIDPPYNTGNEKWVYNDNVNDPKIKKWLGEVVGKEGEDLTRHDKWLCMMYPRLKLLQKLLADDGVIFISIDDNEQSNLRLICDEIFGANNFVESIVWQKRTSPDARKKLSSGHEYILIYAKNSQNDCFNLLDIEGKDAAKFKNPDNDPRGPWVSSDFTAQGWRPNQMYEITTPSGMKMLPPEGRCWRHLESVYKELLAEGRLWFGADGCGVPRKKTYLNEREGKGTWTWWTNAEVGYTQEATQEVAAILGKAIFDYPKPVRLLQRIFKLAASPNSIILDSFAGSGTTAHAVLNMNKADGGHRKFILVEMMDYADSITAERVKRVIKGYGEGKNAVEGTGGNFGFYDLGESLLIGDYLNEAVAPEKIREYVWFMETKQPYAPPSGGNPYYLGKHNSTGYYFYYELQRVTVLDYAFLSTITEKADGTVIYADRCSISEDKLAKMGVTFKKIPRDISRL